MASERLPPSAVRSLVTGGLSRPAVFKDYLSSGSNSQSWECIEWNTEKWSNLFKDELLKVRLGKLNSSSNEPQWEGSCLKGYVSFKDLVQWSAKEVVCTSSCDNEVSSTTHWAYYDYIYMQNETCLNELRDHITWEPFGFTNRGSNESSIWIGTSGSHTPCHQDTYGCNLVAQVKGRKLWTLFPPQQDLYPTRIPYEESSIYSEVDFTNIDKRNFAKLIDTTPYVVTLHPGDVLFVPKHWWHFVESLDLSISVNTWLELPCDNQDQLKEALVQQQIASVCMGIDSTAELSKILNPNMLHVATTSSEEMLACVKNRMMQAFSSVLSHGTQKSKELNDKSDHYKNIADKLVNYNVIELGSIDFDHYLKFIYNSQSTYRKHGADVIRDTPLPPVVYGTGNFDSNDSILATTDTDDTGKRSSTSDSNLVDASQHETNSQNLQSDELHSALILSLTDPRVINLVTQIMLEKMS